MDIKGANKGTGSDSAQSESSEHQKKNRKRRKRWYGFPADYARAHICQLAYDLHVSPIGTVIEHAANVERAKLMVPRPFEEFKNPGQAQLDEYHRRVDELISKMPKPRRWNWFYRVLVAERLLTENAEKYLGLGYNVLYLRQCTFWLVYGDPPPGLVEYRRFIKRVAHVYEVVIPGCSGLEPPDTMPRPPDQVLSWIASSDSLDSVTAGMLVYGAAIECGWTDLVEWAFNRVLWSLCRVASVPPFRTFAVEFVPNVIRSLTPGDRPCFGNWETYVTDALRDYKRIIELAYETGVLALEEDSEVGRVEHELVLLRYADDNKRDRLRREMNSYRRNPEDPSPYITELFQLIDTTEEYRYF